MKRKLKLLAIGAALAILPALSAPASATCYAHEYANVETEVGCHGICAQSGCGYYVFYEPVCQCYPYGWGGLPEEAQPVMTPVSPTQAPAASNPATR